MRAVPNFRTALTTFLLVFLAAVFLAAPRPAEAKPISGGDLSRALEMCLTHPTGQSFELGNVWGCCLPAGGWCVICTGSPSEDKVCEFSYVRSGRPPKGATIYPNVDETLDVDGGKGKSLENMDLLLDLLE